MADGAELDLVLNYGSRRTAFEFKLTNAPQVTKGFYVAQADVKPDGTFVVTPGSERYTIGDVGEVISLPEL